MASIPNVDIDKSSCRVQLSTTEVYTCFAIVAYLSDGTTFIYHMSSKDIDLERSDTRIVAQKIIERSLCQLNIYKADNSSLEDVFIIGGVQEDNYHLITAALRSIKDDFSTITPIFERVNGDDLNNFIQCIKYVNVMMNFRDTSIRYDSDEDASDQLRHSSQVISDITVISDKTSQPPLLCLAQYFGVEDDLHGGERTVQPWIIYLFDFAHRSWHVFDRHPPAHIYSSHVQKVLSNFKDDLFSNMADEVINNVIKRIEH